MICLLVAVIIAALIFDFANGMGDSANAIATVVSTRVLAPMQAVVFAAILNFAGALVSTKVAQTIAEKMVDPGAVDLWMLLAAMLGCSFWKFFCTLKGLPVSGTHALLGGFFGAVVFAGGFNALKWGKVTEALLAMLASPALGFIFAYILLVIVYWIAYAMSREAVRRTFNVAQVFSSGYMAFEHGKNDAQKVMGIITLALVIAHQQNIELPEIMQNHELHHVPMWVMVMCGLVIAAGTAAGGWKVVKTLGMKLAHIRPIEGFAAETGAGITLTIAASLGVPVSTTHTITGAILGCGTAYKAKTVKWGVGAKIVYAWFLTLPVTFVIAGLISLIFRLFAASN